MYERPLADIEFIVVHHSATPETFTPADIRHEHVDINHWSDIGYHYLIYRKDGDAVMATGRDIHYPGAHVIPDLTSDNGTLTHPEINNRSAIGICIIGSFESVAPEHDLVNQTAYVIKRVAEKYKVKLDRKHIVPQKYVSATACPGKDTINLIYKALKI